MSLALLLMSVVGAVAQSMSDDQVIQFAQQQQASGKGQQEILQQLLKKGVTPEQMRRIRRKLEAEKNQLGAVDLNSNGRTGQNRLRTNAKAQDDLQKRNGYMVQSRAEQTRRLTPQERLDGLTDEVGFLDLDSVLYYQNLLKDESAVFGRDIFNNPYLTFEPNQNMATPANYRLGAGDRVIIDVWGASQQSFDSTISPDGYVVVEGVGPIKLGGLSVQQATSTVKSRLGQYYSDCSISLSVGETRSIQVQVLGEVKVPGTYTLSSLSSAFNALYAAGGINDIGTLRNIKVYRSGKQISTIDVYDYLINGNASGDVRLQDNDVVLVGPYDCLVNIRGKVKRPMWYEMKSNESVKQILGYAGGFAGDAYTKNISLTRKQGSEYSIHTVEEFQMANFQLKDQDSIYVDSVLARFSNMVEIRGAVKHAGQFQLGGNIQTVRELLLAADGLREDAFRTRAVMHREKADLSLEMVSVDVDGILAGTVADIPLRKNDVLFIPSTVDMRGEQTFQILGEVIYPGTYQYAENTSVEDLILQAGGLTAAASTAKVDVFRRLNQSNATVNAEEMAEVFTITLQDGLRAGDSIYTLKPFDVVVVRKSPAYSEQQNVWIRGSVNFEGAYTMTSKNFRLSDLVKQAGGLSSLAYAKGARLERRMTEEERLQRENTLRNSQIQMYEEAMQSTDKNYNLNLADSLLSMKLELGSTYPVAINLDEALKQPGGDDDIVLREGDVLVVPQYSNTVKVSGEVMYPISMNWEKGKKLSYYIKHAGGYGNRAKKKQVYAVYMNGAVEKINKLKTSDIQPGCEIVVPTKPQGNKMTTGEVMAIASGGASLASVVVALISILK